MSGREKMLAAVKAVQAANSAIKREMGKITVAERMDLLSDAESRHSLRNAIRELEATLKELKKL